MTAERVLVHGHPLPPQIRDAIDNGTWVLPSAAEKIKRLFGQAASPGAKLYCVEGMVRETEAWANAPEEELAHYGGPGADAGDFLTLDPQASVLIGDLGYDMPIALDYGFPASADRPRVVYLPAGAPGWIEVAADVSSFMERLGLESTR